MLHNENHNDNQYDQLFRDRLGDHSSPVRADLWRRIHSGISTTVRRLHPWHSLRYFGVGAATLIAALAAAHYLYVLHSPFRQLAKPTHRLASTDNHYSTIKSATRSDSSPSATAPAQPVPPPGPDSNYGEIAAIKTSPPTGTPAANPTATNPTTSNPTTSKSTMSNPTAAIGHVSTARIAYPARNPRPNPLTSRLNPDRRRPNPVATNSIIPGPITPGLTNPGSTPATHHLNPVTLPAIARTSTRGPIPARPLMLKSRHNDPNSSNATAATPRPIKIGYVSLYGSVDFPANHYYTWSYTVGGTVTIQFSRHWSGTAGLEYGRVNVPTQVVPPVGPFDTLHAFYFSNYEVPVLIGYTMMLGSYALTINAGAILNIYQHQSNSPGNLVTSATSTWVFNWPNRDAYGAYVGTDIFRPLGRSIRLFAQPYARYSISNYRMFIPVQRFSYGALLGIRYQL